MNKQNKKLKKKQIKYCVGIGASAGGVEALQELFRNMPVDTGASFVVVQHLSPDAVSMMDKILQKSVRMQVKLAEEGMELEPNEIYLNVPGMTLEVRDGRLRLTPAESRNQRYSPINLMLNSLASEKDIHTIAVILSGSGSDGTIGIGSVKENGGIIIVQKPIEAQYSSMPQSAITTGLVDLTENVSNIGNAIRDYLKNPNVQYIHHEEGIENQELAEDFERIVDAVTRYSDIDFSAYKPNTIFRRIERRIAINNLSGMSEYLDYILSSQEEKGLLCSDFLIGVTSFFRDEDAFKSLGEQVLTPLLLNKKSIRIWSIACSTGEEAYSVAILVCELMERLKRNVEIKIFATDTDPESIATAQKGIYSEGSLSPLGETVIEKYFEKRDYGYAIKEKVRKLIVFAKHNLFKDAPFSKLDLIICRNMFIYVKAEIQQKAFKNFYHLLNEDGYLFLGSSESLGDMDEAFEGLDKKWKIYKKNIGYHAENSSFFILDSLTQSAKQTDEQSASNLRRKIRTTNIFEKMLFHLVGPSVLVDGYGKIVQIIQGGGKYLSLQDGQFDNSINSCFVQSLTILLNHIMEEMKEKNAGSVERLVTGIADYPEESLKIRVSFFNIENGEYYLIQISPGGPVPAQGETKDPIDLRELQDSRIRQLEKELSESNWKLSLAVEESESRNEELQATNEELLASNEELQSTNEEMQSVNEELYTINAEHQNKIMELTTANTDFDNLLINAEVGALYIDRNMKIRKITPIMLHNTNLLPTDLERPVSHINFMDNYKCFIEDVENVFQNGVVIEKEVSDQNNITWLLRIRPYYEKSHKSAGVLVTMFDITKRLTDNVPGGVVRMHYDGDLVIDYANNSFYAMSGYSMQEVKEKFRSRFSRMIEHEDWEGIKEQIESAVEKGAMLKADYRMCRNNKPSSWNSIQAMIYKEGSVVELQGIITDISKIKDYEKQLTRERDFYDTLYQNMLCGIMQYENKNDTLCCCGANPAAVKMLGYSSMEEFRKQPRQTLPELACEEEQNGIAKKLLSLKKKGDSIAFEQHVLRADGEQRLVNGEAKMITAPDGKNLIQCTFMDVTEERQAIEQLKNERDRYDRLYQMSYNMAVCGIIQSDVKNGNVITINKEALRILEEDETSLGKRIFDGQSAVCGQKEMNLAGIGKLLSSIGKNGHKAFKGILHLNQDRHICIDGSADWVMEDAQTRVVQFTFLDTTERELLQEAEMKLEVATKASEAKSGFLSKMSHEIRTPMNGIVGMIDSAMLYIHDEKKLRDCLNKMKRSSEHLQQLVNDVLDMSKIESGKMDVELKQLDLKKLLSNVIDDFGYLAEEKGIGLSQAGNYSHSCVISDAVKLREILDNLIGNAIKFTEAAGFIVLIVEEEPVTAETSSFTFRVKDSGKGISEENQTMIFNAFEQGSDSNLFGNTGSGLGLAICKNLVEMLGGELSVESRVGKGSEFYFTLTFKVVENDITEEAVQKPETCYEGLRVLVAEDNVLNGEIAEIFLKAYGFDVDLVLNGKEAVDKFKKEPEGAYCLVLMDIQMPVMDGYKAVRQIRGSGRRDAETIPILAMSANAFKEDVELSLKAGMNGHMAKPINMQALLQKIQEYVKPMEMRSAGLPEMD